MIVKTIIDHEFVAQVVTAVIAELDKREKDKQEERVAQDRKELEAEKEAVRARQQKYIDAHLARQADCKHEHKITHNFTDGVRSWTVCRSCDKTWKEDQPYAPPESRGKWDTLLAKPFLNKCKHEGGLRTVPSVTGAEFVRCERCMKQWRER